MGKRAAAPSQHVRSHPEVASESRIAASDPYEIIIPDSPVEAGIPSDQMNIVAHASLPAGPSPAASMSSPEAAAVASPISDTIQSPWGFTRAGRSRSPVQRRANLVPRSSSNVWTDSNQRLQGGYSDGVSGETAPFRSEDVLLQKRAEQLHDRAQELKRRLLQTELYRPAPVDVTDL